MRILSWTIALILAICMFFSCAHQRHSRGIEICGFNSLESLSGNLTMSKINGLADTTLSMIRGQIWDENARGLAYAKILLISIDRTQRLGSVCDANGSFAHWFPSGKYRLEVSSPGYNALAIDTLQLIPGSIQTLEAHYFRENDGKNKR